jgi:hypothetical protein
VLLGKFLEHRDACLGGAASVLDVMEKMATEKMEKKSEGTEKKATKCGDFDVASDARVR